MLDELPVFDTIQIDVEARDSVGGPLGRYEDEISLPEKKRISSILLSRVDAFRHVPLV